MPDHHLRIGEFARASGLSVKALRHYARIGVLRPAHTDPRTGYRYYDTAQLATVEEIRTLARLGLPLARVRELVGGAPPVSLRAALLAARASVQGRLREDRERLVAIEDRLAALERLERPERSEVFLSSQPSRLVGAVRDRLISYAGADELLAEARSALREPRGEATGLIAGVIWHDCGKQTGMIDCEGLVAVSAIDRALSTPRSRRVRLRRLPGATTACVVHCGTDETISAAYGAAWRWITEQGYALAGPIREWYLQGASDSPESVTEIHFPILRRGTRA